MSAALALVVLMPARRLARSVANVPGSLHTTPADLSMQPGLGCLPLSVNRARCDTHNLGSLLNREARKESEFDQLTLLRVYRLELCQRIVKRQQVHLALRKGC